MIKDPPYQWPMHLNDIGIKFRNIACEGRKYDFVFLNNNELQNYKALLHREDPQTWSYLTRNLGDVDDLEPKSLYTKAVARIHDVLIVPLEDHWDVYENVKKQAHERYMQEWEKRQAQEELYRNVETIHKDEEQAEAEIKRLMAPDQEELQQMADTCPSALTKKQKAEYKKLAKKGKTIEAKYDQEIQGLYELFMDELWEWLAKQKQKYPEVDESDSDYEQDYDKSHLTYSQQVIRYYVKELEKWIKNMKENDPRYSLCLDYRDPYPRKWHNFNTQMRDREKILQQLHEHGYTGDMPE